MRRHIFFILTGLILLTGVSTYYFSLSAGWPGFFVILFLLGIYDILQRQHTILRNYPVIGHFRFLLELIRPEIRQYFVETDVDAYPLSRIQRSLVYEKAKATNDTVPFGSQLDLYAQNYKWLNHSCFPVEASREDFHVMIGNLQCRQPYKASLLNISAMSYGALSKSAVRALGLGAKAGGFYHNTGEGGLSPFHLETGADLVWQLGTAYFGARDKAGYFDPELFRQKANLPQVKMIEIKISQGAKPGHGGVLPGEKVDAEIAEIRQVEIGKTVVSPPGHTAFTTPQELCHFIAKLRELTNGKPIGFKLCLGRREEFVKICQAMIETDIFPDFITVDGGEGGTGAAPYDFINYVGSPLKEALYFIDSTLKKYKIRSHMKLIASGKVFSGFDMFERFALGADLCNSARGMMLALGCIQSYRCNTNKCPTGITTSDPALTQGLVIPDKSVRVTNFHNKTLSSLSDLIGAAGLHSPTEIDLKHVSCRHDGRILTLAELYESVDELSQHEEKDRHTETRGEPKTPEPQFVAKPE